MNAPADNTNRGRRVTDKHGGILDAAHQAVQLKEVEGDLRLLNQTVSGNIKALESSINSLQIESRGIVAKIDGLIGLQAQHDTNREVLAELKRSVADLGIKMERWADDERKERDEWQLRHEADNENESRTTAEKIDKINGKVNVARGAVSVIVLLGGCIVTGFLWNINMRFQASAESIVAVVGRVDRNAENIEEVDDRLREIELYLARGGQSTVDPYRQQRKDNDGNR